VTIQSSMRPRFLFASLAAIVAVIAGFTAWYMLRPPVIPAGFVFSNGRIEATEIDIATKIFGRN
jgi:HlyD family secretion protein